MPYLIDTDFLIDYIGNVPGATDLFASLAPERVAMSTVTFMEAYEGTLTSDDPAIGQGKLAAVLQDVLLIPFYRRVAVSGAELRARLRRQSARVNSRANDLNIAATALAYNLTIITRNNDDFGDLGIPLLPYT